MKFLDILIKEGRKEDLKKKYSDKYDEEDLDFILGISDLQDFNHKYTDWVLKHILEYADVETMAETAVDLVKDFDKYQKNLQKKDINQYLSFEELEKALEPYKEKEKEKELKSQTEKIFEDDNFLVLIPKTHEAACKYGSGTKWCVTQKDSSHFKRYTEGKQTLYFIIRKKAKQATNQKIAVHIVRGTENWWNSLDNLWSDDSISLFKEYFPQVYESIHNYEKKLKALSIGNLDNIFDVQNNFYYEFKVLGSEIRFLLMGYYTLDTGKAGANLKIYLNEVQIDEYKVYINYNNLDSERWKVSIGFDNENDSTNVNKFDFELQDGWGFDHVYPKLDSTDKMRKHFERNFFGALRRKISDDVEFLKFIKNQYGPAWRPNRFYGYTFKKNEGLIKKLVDWLDSNKIGTKLTFLADIGKLKEKKENNVILYALPDSENYQRSYNFRGHFSSFFASAKNAGILDYTKVGNQFLMKKGPNFEAFKNGELKEI